MANLSITFTRTSPAGSVTRNRDYSDADFDRLQAAAIAELQAQEIPNPTNGQVADYLFSRIRADFKNLTRNHETRAADQSRTNIGL